jgi:small subunit ribosomal protein S7
MEEEGSTPEAAEAPSEAPAEGGAQPPPDPEPEPPAPTFDVKLLGRWDVAGIVVKDAGLARYINLSPMFLPHSGGRYGNRPFGKVKANLVERLINSMMRTEDFTGKKFKAIKTVRRAFELVEERTKQNPIQVLVDALQNAAPREEITRLKFGGISVPKAVDISPSRRLDVAMRYICQGAVQASFRSTTPIEECLANEITKAAKGDINSFAVAKKEELERIASSAR